MCRKNTSFTGTCYSYDAKNQTPPSMFRPIYRALLVNLSFGAWNKRPCKRFKLVSRLGKKNKKDLIDLNSGRVYECTFYLLVHMRAVHIENGTF